MENHIERLILWINLWRPVLRRLKFLRSLVNTFCSYCWIPLYPGRPTPLNRWVLNIDWRVRLFVPDVCLIFIFKVGNLHWRSFKSFSFGFSWYFLFLGLRIRNFLIIFKRPLILIVLLLLVFMLKFSCQIRGYLEFLLQLFTIVIFL